jgi:chemotaxis protein MotA
MSPVKVLKDLMKGIIQSLKGSPFNRVAYEELFKAMYELFRLARRSGFLSLEPHLSNPHGAAIFQNTQRSPATTMSWNSSAARSRDYGRLRQPAKTSPELTPSSTMKPSTTPRRRAHQDGGCLLASIVAAVLGIVITM